MIIDRVKRVVACKSSKQEKTFDYVHDDTYFPSHHESAIARDIKEKIPMVVHRK